MKNPVDITRGYQIRYMILGQVIVSVFMAILQFFMVIGSFGNDKIRIFIGVLTIVIYFLYMTYRAYTLAKNDKKSYTPLKPGIKWALIWGISLFVFNILLISIYTLDWKLFSDGTTLNGVFAIITNIIFYILQSPFLAFTVKCVGGNLSVGLMAVMVVIPFVSSLAGYYVAMNEYSIMDKVRGIMFETDKKGK